MPTECTTNLGRSVEWGGCEDDPDQTLIENTKGGGVFGAGILYALCLVDCDGKELLAI